MIKDSEKNDLDLLALENCEIVDTLITLTLNNSSSQKPRLEIFYHKKMKIIILKIQSFGFFSVSTMPPKPFPAHQHQKIFTKI